MGTRWKAPLLAGVLLLGVGWLFGGAAGGRAAAVPGSRSDGVWEIEGWPVSEAAARGRRVYETWCIGCHGPEGRGDGPAARWLNPAPRNFQAGFYKFRSTRSGDLPTRDDLFKTVTCGLVGSSMPDFRLLSEGHRRDVVEYVLHLTAFGLAIREASLLMETEGLSMDEVKAGPLEGIRREVAERIDRVRPVAVTPEPPVSEEGIETARTRYMAQCASCHGSVGRGDGSSSYTLRDWEDGEIRPRDFTTGVFRAGSSSLDLFLRMRTGLNGTPMPATEGTDEELWNMVHFIQSLEVPTVFPRDRQGCRHEGGR